MTIYVFHLAYDWMAFDTFTVDFESCRVENDTVRLWKGLPRIRRPRKDINLITLIKALSIRPTYVIHTLHNTLIIGQFS